MKTILLTIKVFLFSMVCVQAQNQPYGNLTVFSEDGYPFYLVMNGEKQNDIAQSNIRVEELLQPYYNVRIFFKDSMLGFIVKPHLMVAGPDGFMSDVTYRIKVGKGGKPQLNYYSSVPVMQDFIPPAGLYVHRFGQPVRGEEAVITTTVSSGPVAAVNMSAGGVNVTVNTPVFTETTVVTSSNTVTANMPDRTYAGSSRGGGGKVCSMRDEDFIDAKKSIAAANFEDSKLSTAKSIASANSLSTIQVIEICKVFNFEETKLTFAKFAYRYTTDPKNYYKVSGVFAFDSNKVSLNQFLSGNQ